MRGGGGAKGWGEYDTPDPALCVRLPQLRIPRLLFFSPPPPSHDGRASCGAGSQLCFLSQSPFMWSLPRVLPVDSEGRGGVFSPRRAEAGRQAGGTACSYWRPRAAAIANALASAAFHNIRHCPWFKSKNFTVTFPGCPVLPK